MVQPARGRVLRMAEGLPVAAGQFMAAVGSGVRGGPAGVGGVRPGGVLAGVGQHGGGDPIDATEASGMATASPSTSSAASRTSTMVMIVEGSPPRPA